MFAAVSSAVKDLDRLRDLTRSVHNVAASWMQIGSTVYASSLAAEPRSCPELAMAQEKSQDFHWVGPIASGQSIEIRGINGGITAEPAPGSDLEVFAVKKARRSDPASVEIKVVPHAGGVTICAVYPNENSDASNSCQPGGPTFNSEARPQNRESSGTMNIRNNDVNVEFKVRVPVGVAFVGRTVNGEIAAKALNGNVDSRTVNGSIDIATAGYARARTVNGEISARMGRADWKDTLDFKTVNGGIDLDFPASLNTTIEAETFNGEIESDFPLKVLGRISRKHMSGTIGEGGRELLLKTFNGSIRVKKSS
jgi:hypothetical protein